MQIKKAIKSAVVAGILLLPTTLFAQSNGLNTFSPYTFYGIGDLSIQGPAYLRSMGGAGIAYREPAALNYLNPASMSAAARKTFLFNFGLEGKNTYLKNNQTQSSHNTFNVRDIAIQFPLAKGLGFGLSVTPFSSVGYNVITKETDPTIIADLGDVHYVHLGEGDITQLKAGLGWEVFRNFSIGAEMIFYKGDLLRTSSATISSVTGEGTYVAAILYDDFNVSRIGANFGVQYSPIYNLSRMLTFGATYQPKLDLNPAIRRDLVGNYSTAQVLNELPTTIPGQYTLPQTIAGGVYYHNLKISVGMDYVFQEWKGINQGYASDNVSYKNTHTVRGGLQYTPNAFDVRRFMRRLTYRIGFRYSDYYLTYNGKSVNDKAITAGIGFPLAMARNSNINVGIEFGQRGTTRSNMVKENYFKFSLGLSLFGSDDWFKKYKYE